MFWVNVPFCLAGLALAARFMPADRPSPGAPRPPLDLPGLALLAPGLAAVILGLSNAGSADGFAHPDVIIPLAAGAALTAAFAGYALRLAARRGQPLVDVRLLARRPVASASAVLFFSGFSLYGAMLLLPLYYQEVRGDSALTAGIMLIPQGIGTLLSRPLAGRLTDKTGGRPLAVAGFALTAAATVPFAWAGAAANAWLLALCLVVRGFGLGSVIIPVMAGAFRGLDKEQISHASVLTRTVQQIGGSFGGAVLAVILTEAIAARHGAPPGGFHVAFWWATAFSAFAVLLACWLPGAPGAEPGPPAAQPEAVQPSAGTEPSASAEPWAGTEPSAWPTPAPGTPANR
jgi:nitrate/nitrite transporter NarK